jgi:hypothetical protein
LHLYEQHTDAELEEFGHTRKMLLTDLIDMTCSNSRNIPRNLLTTAAWQNNAILYWNVLRKNQRCLQYNSLMSPGMYSDMPAGLNLIRIASPDSSAFSRHAIKKVNFIDD